MSRIFGVVRANEPRPSGDVSVMFDGHIYNRAELGSFDTDTSLIVALYRKQGFPETLSRLNGDFAIVLHDPTTATLWLGRDRIGIKPLYYATLPGAVAFASQPGQLLTVSGVARDVNRAFVGRFAGLHYRHFDSFPEESPYHRIFQVRPGHCVAFKDAHCKSSAYWSLDDLPDFTDDENTLAEQYRELLLDAVRLRALAARRPAFTLSGGMDSSSVLGCAVQALGARQVAFSSVYRDKTYDETEEIRSMLDSAVSHWHPVSIELPDVFSIVARMIDAHHEPVATATWLSHFLVCEEVKRQGFHSLFGGLGGDELNAGEYEHFWYFFADLRKAGDEERLEREVQQWARYHDHPVYRKSLSIMNERLPAVADLRQPGRCLPDRERLTRYASAINSEYFDIDDFEPPMPHPFQSYLKTRTYQDLTLETTPCCLRAEDRHGAAFGLDHFLPFFDHRVVEFMFRVPGTLKFRDGVSKWLLRRAMQGILPEVTRTRVKKVGWNAPAHIWFAGAGRDSLLDLICSRSFRERGIYRLDEVERIIRDHDAIVSSRAAAENHMMFLWQLVNLELWFQWLEQPVTKSFTMSSVPLLQ